MWRVVCALAGALVASGDGLGGEGWARAHEDSDLYDYYEEEVLPWPARIASDSDTLTRVRRYGPTRSVQTLATGEAVDVKDALRLLFAGRDMEQSFTATTLGDDDLYKPLTELFITDLYADTAQNYTLETTEHPTRIPPNSSSREKSTSGRHGDALRGDNTIPAPDDNTTDPTFTTNYGPTSGTTESTRSAVYSESTATTTGSKTKSPRFDIEALLDIVANLTYGFDMNLTRDLNETLQRYSIPTCKTPTTTVTTTTLTTPEVFYNTTVISKCFVCGLETPGIPRNAFCADAFATDFLPLVPIDPRAKGMIARYRKYCRYFDVNNYQLNKSDPRALLGRWTGGCAVRWIDLSGVYTQRVCRNRLRPLTGLHFASKRMAKLELALSNVDDGCIISPMATLVPLSRGISLYARFHACVCTGSWCNGAQHPALGYITLLLYLLIILIIK